MTAAVPEAAGRPTAGAPARRDARLGSPLRGCGVLVALRTTTPPGPLRVRVFGPALDDALVDVHRVRARPFSARLAPWERSRWERSVERSPDGSVAATLACASPGLAAVWVECDARPLRAGEGALCIEVAGASGEHIVREALLLRVLPAEPAGEAVAREYEAGPSRAALRAALRDARSLCARGLAPGAVRPFRAHALFAARDESRRATLGARMHRGAASFSCAASARSLVEAWLRGRLRALYLEALGEEPARVSLEALADGRARLEARSPAPGR